ncbi:MAG: hypothetical protein Ta2D_02640 [Rickettsiales bacterium]|nr:MAG: hypothetical protein Ta2D_02640 [Rickettsiales bacterium]
MLIINSIFIVVLCFIIIASDITKMEIPSQMQLCFLILNLSYIFNKNYDLMKCFVSGISYFGVIFAVSYLIKKIKKKESIGGADIKLIGIAGLTLGFKNINYFFLIASFVAIITAFFYKKEKKVPFGIGIMTSYLILLFY